MMEKHFFFIGHFAIDIVIKNKTEHEPSLGGSVSFGSLGLRAYTKNASIQIISNCGSKNLESALLNDLRKKNIDLQGIKWSDSCNTNFILEYFDHTRQLTLKSRSPDLEFSDIPKEHMKNPPDVVILAPLCNEISYDYVATILKQFPKALIGIDLQGFIRKIDDKGKVSYIPDEKIILNMRKIMNLIGERLILKGSEVEMKLLAGGSEDLNSVMEKFDAYNLKGLFIMTLGESGSMIIKYGQKLLKIPAFSSNGVKDETGAGDVYFAIFLYEYINSDMSWSAVKESACLASAAASFLVEEIGPSGFESKKNIKKRIEKRNYILQRKL